MPELSLLTQRAAEASEYQQTLAKLIERSDRIVVTEHSDQFNAFDVNAGKSLIQSEIVYGTRVLDASQKSLFLSMVKGLDPKLQNAFPPLDSHPRGIGLHWQSNI